MDNRDNFIDSRQGDIKKTIASILKKPLRHPDVDDVYQNTMIELLKDRVWNSFEGKSGAARFTWVIGVAKMVILRFWEKQKKTISREFVLPEDYKERPHIDKHKKLTLESLNLEQEEVLTKFIDYLPDIYEETLLLRLKGHTYKEIGEIQGIPLATASERINYVKNYIDRFYSEYCNEM